MSTNPQESTDPSTPPWWPPTDEEVYPPDHLVPEEVRAVRPDIRVFCNCPNSRHRDVTVTIKCAERSLKGIKIMNRDYGLAIDGLRAHGNTKRIEKLKKLRNELLKFYDDRYNRHSGAPEKAPSLMIMNKRDYPMIVESDEDFKPWETAEVP
ncbi:uncharacterized protein KY384_007472 [Bacidia gigantensis]|uniref:uncharacterized protein n=1 Tax=Bacidia gigantensis TaxID=2732470 RepID=UPI001D0389B1|nr:uncharacterized protein KY384_007472 [Bacidia gigantensis]KAG8527320.1 hypothetical protein KY384_007472 [Bacidia gigantensis]